MRYAGVRSAGLAELEVKLTTLSTQARKRPDNAELTVFSRESDAAKQHEMRRSPPPDTQTSRSSRARHSVASRSLAGQAITSAHAIASRPHPHRSAPRRREDFAAQRSHSRQSCSQPYANLFAFSALKTAISDREEKRARQHRSSVSCFRRRSTDPARPSVLRCPAGTCEQGPVGIEGAKHTPACAGRALSGKTGRSLPNFHAAKQQYFAVREIERFWCFAQSRGFDARAGPHAPSRARILVPGSHDVIAASSTPDHERRRLI